MLAGIAIMTERKLGELPVLNSGDSATEYSKLFVLVVRQNFPYTLDGWPSGLRRTPGERVDSQGSRGFESHPVRCSSA